MTINELFTNLYTKEEGRLLLEALDNFRWFDAHYKVALEPGEIVIRISTVSYDEVEPNRPIEPPLTLWNDEGPLAFSKEWIAAMEVGKRPDRPQPEEGEGNWWDDLYC